MPAVVLPAVEPQLPLAAGREVVAKRALDDDGRHLTFVEGWYDGDGRQLYAWRVRIEAVPFLAAALPEAVFLQQVAHPATCIQAARPTRTPAVSSWDHRRHARQARWWG